MAFKLRDRILTWSIASTVLIVLVVLLLVDTVFGNTIRRTAEENLATGAGLVGELRRARVDGWITQVAGMALEPTLRASLETSDPATIEQILDEARANTQSDWLAVATPEGDLLASSGPAPVERIRASKALLERTPNPTETEIRYWLAGNLCRCTGYDKIITAVQDAAVAMRKG